ncbi:TPA: hypothetical protein ACP5TQ_004182 [Vibrio parahaemolyticus]
MTIQAAEIQRDDFGYWTHPELPEWDESTQIDEIDAWFASNGLTYFVSYLENGDDEVAEAKYYEESDPDISGWHPKPPQDGAFLLSIHDTENGPVAIWAVHGDQSTPPSA